MLNIDWIKFQDIKKDYAVIVPDSSKKDNNYIGRRIKVFFKLI
ncbi:hypothetical protein [Spiroplasma kunkelii]|nr:hypothetical protein [Spiroplasma kunkelii]